MVYAERLDLKRKRRHIGRNHQRRARAGWDVVLGTGLGPWFSLRGGGEVVVLGTGLGPWFSLLLPAYV